MKTRHALALVLALSLLLSGCAVVAAAAIGFGVGFGIAGPVGGPPGAAAGVAVQFWNEICAFFTKLGNGIASFFGVEGGRSGSSGGGGGGGSGSGGGGAQEGFRWWDPAYWTEWVWLILGLLVLWVFLRARALAPFRSWLWQTLVGLLPGARAAALARGKGRAPPRAEGEEERPPKG